MSSQFEWNWKTRNYASEKKEMKLYAEEVLEHPLKPSIITVKENKISVRRLKTTSGNSTPLSTPATPSRKGAGSTTYTSLDPLSSALDGMDPLSQMACDPLSQMAMAPEMKNPNAVGNDELDSTFEPWSAKKSSILNKYTTSEKLSITTSFLSGGEKVLVKTQSTVTDKVKNRLEQLDDFEEGSVKEMLDLSQQDYVNRIDELNSAMKEAWDQDQKVKSLKIVIQCSKLLADTNVIQFYPSKFVLITDILDMFGKLVYERILSKTQYAPSGAKATVSLPDDFSPDQVPESAKETCRNWFFKISSIRELIPRFFVETAIIRTYIFLSKTATPKAVNRLSGMIRGIGNPLIAAYAQCYLCRVGHVVAPGEKSHIKDTFDNFLQTYSQLTSQGAQKIMSEQRLRIPQYLILYTPALDWILQCLTHEAPEVLLTEVLEKCRNRANSTLLLNSIMTAFQPEYIAKRALLFINLMKESDESGFPRHILFRTLGLCLVITEPKEEEKLQVLNDVWKAVIKLRNPADYMSCAEIWIEYPVKHFTKKEVNTFLADIIRHVTPDRAFENHYQQLYGTLDRIVTHLHDFSVIFSMDKFLPFIDLFQKESVKIDVCKMIMESYSKHQTEPTNDAVITNAVMYICKVMHDSVNALTVEDEKRQISCLISAFVRSVSFGRDFEQQLSFYVECRASFTNLEMVNAFLVQSVNRLAMETRKIVKGHHTRKTSSFVKACVAYCFITIPSLTDCFIRLQLYLLSGQVALLNQCLSQADAFFRAAIGLIAEVPRTIEVDGKIKSSECILLNYLNNFLSTLLIVPDHPEQGVLYLIRGLLNVLHDYTWDNNSDALVSIYINMLCLLSAIAQETFAYHIELVDSNDALYGSDVKYLNEVKGVSRMLLEQVLGHLMSLGDNNNSKRQAALAFELFHKLITHCDLDNDGMLSLAGKLWAFAHSTQQIDSKYSNRVVEYIKKKGTKKNGKSYAALTAKLNTKS